MQQQQPPVLLFKAGHLGQWHGCEFHVDETKYNCAEQYMMHGKALLMGDGETASLIMATDSPREQKRLGRSVKNFDQTLWNEKCRNIVIEGNFAKFSQNEELKKKLLETYPRQLAEANKNDRIWGIGRDWTDPLAKDPSKWLGMNWLGECLMDVRQRIMES
ncbi:uncharacterized protein MGAL_10B081319 [Mytilus galloprovincialis]|uniref:NADAR domain-containing protein n=1 Tax=Mytilus galloprovincialis TaxID=29158 RepID=A0A8B6FNU1_MYTGA|nr:uncharacterized protein MGAL_10B081319 [Mytilus galloprovincialis]